MRFITTFITLIIFISSSAFAEDVDGKALQWLNGIMEPEQVACLDREDCICIKYKHSQLSRYSLARYCPMVGLESYEVRTWDKEGNKVDEGYWLNGKPDGVWTSWHSNGVKAAESFSVNGKEEGKFTTWHDNGAISVVGYHKEGQNHGTWIYKNQNGKVIKKFEWDSGKLVSRKEFE